MAKSFSDNATYAGLSPETVFARHTDADFLERKYAALGACDIEVDVDRDGDNVTLTIDRKVDVDVPGFAKRVLKPTNSIHLVELWRPDGDGYACDWTVKSSPAPAQLHGTRTLAPAGDGTKDSTLGNVEVSVPLIGGKLADWLSGEASSELADELAWIAQQPA